MNKFSPYEGGTIAQLRYIQLIGLFAQLSVKLHNPIEDTLLFT